MDDGKREDIEAKVRKLCQAADFEGAATVALRGYGPEIFTFLGARHRERADADEVFAEFAEGLWRALPGFAWASSLRTFAYAIARRTSLHYHRSAGRRRKRHEDMGDGSVVSLVAAEVRSATAPIFQTNVKNRLAEIRASLPEEDQELLILRVDRALSWLALAEVLRDEDAPPLEGEAHKREAARLRKRFQLIKDKLRDIARREGLIETPNDD